MQHVCVCVCLYVSKIVKEWYRESESSGTIGLYPSLICSTDRGHLKRQPPATYHTHAHTNSVTSSLQLFLTFICAISQKEKNKNLTISIHGSLHWWKKPPEIKRRVLNYCASSNATTDLNEGTVGWMDGCDSIRWQSLTVTFIVRTACIKSNKLWLIDMMKWAPWRLLKKDWCPLVETHGTEINGHDLYCDAWFSRCDCVHVLSY